MAGLGLRYEVLYVDDGSRDASFSILQRIREADPCVRLLRFRRNYGQTAALAAALERTQGNVVVTLDSDRQNDPRDIARLLARLGEGYDLVSGWRKDRKDDFWSRRLPSVAANHTCER